MKSEAIVEHLCASEFGKKEHSGHGEASQVGTGQPWLLCGLDWHWSVLQSVPKARHVCL